MGQYVAPLRDMQFVLHELLNVEANSNNCLRTPKSMQISSTRSWKKAANSLPEGTVPAEPFR
jgi:hypothetical protein